MITNKQFYDAVEKVIDINALAQKSHNFLDKNAIKKQKKLIKYQKKSYLLLRFI